MKNTLAIALFIFFAAFKPAVAAAEQELVKIAACRSQSVEISMLLEPGTTLKDGGNVVAVSSQISALTGLNLTTSAVYHAADKSYDLPHWKPGHLSASDCSLPIHPFRMGPPAGPLQDELMYLQEFMIEGDYSPDIDIDDLVQKGEAIPLKVHVVCRTRQIGSGVMNCEQVRILDEIIPVNTSPKPVPPKPLPSKPVVSQTVQLTSGLCGSTSKLQSSGAIVDMGGKSVVVTSSGAVVSDQGANSCTTATLSDGRTFSLTLEVQDWAQGLALLDFPAGTSLVSFRLRDPNSQTAFDTATVGSRKFAVLAESSTRHFIPLVETVVELQGDELTSQDVGAPVLDADGQLAAIVSDSYLKIFPGSLTRPERFAAGEHANHLIAVSAETISDWLSQSRTVPSVWAVPASQFKGPVILKAGHLVIEESCPSLSAKDPDPDYPIGGGDAAGIGGDSTEYRACTMKFSLDETGDDVFFGYGMNLQKWHDNVVAALKSGQTVEVPFEAGRTKAGSLDRVYNYSASSFFQSLVKMPAGFAPIDIRLSSSGKIGSDPALTALRAVATDLKSTARTVYAGFTVSDPVIGALIRKTYLLGILAESENWNLLTASDFTSTLDPAGANSGAWATLVKMAYDGPRLKKDVQSLGAELEKVKP